MSNLTPRSNRLETNLVIDGGMEIWPEGASRTVASGSSAYGSVLFRLSNAASSVTLTNARQSAVPANTNLQFSNQVSKTAAGTLSAATSVRLSHYVEGYNISSIFNSEFTVLFWVRSSVASNRTLCIQNAGATHSYLKQYSINTANTWELKAIRFPALSGCPGTIDTTNGIGVEVIWNIVSGTTFQSSTLNSWVSGTFYSGTGENTTWLTGTNHDFSVAGVMVMPGNLEGLVASRYMFTRAGRTFMGEYALSQRYFEKSNNLETVPGTDISSSSEPMIMDIGAVTTGGARHLLPFKSEKRANPTVRVWSDTGVIDRVRGSISGLIVASMQNASTSKAHIQFSIPAANLYLFQYSADARF